MNRTVVMAAVAAAAFVGWHFLAPSEEARVKETFAKASAAIGKNGAEPNLEALGKARKAVALVEPGCTLEAFGRTFTLSKSVPDITQQVVAFRMMAASLDVAFEDIAVKFTDKSTAEASYDFFYRGDDFGWSVRDARALDATLRKDPESGRWRFARVRLSNIIEK